MTRENIELLVNSDLFELDHYSQESGLIFENKHAAARHYLEVGFSRRISPSRRFDPAYYVEVNSDVADAGINPLVHYIGYGRQEGRRAALSRSPRAARPRAPSTETWATFTEHFRDGMNQAEAANDTSASVDVIIPVYRGIDDTLACIESVLRAHVSTPYRLIVMDDESPEPELSKELLKLAEQGLIQLFRNEYNLGFVGTVNRGMQLSVARDVILLNSDTIVYGDWIDRLRSQAYSLDRVATVTPLSNNATIFSYPHTLRSNPQNIGVDFPDIDRIAKDKNSGKNVVVPTGVGFCFYIRRLTINEIGFLDADLFGKGYGEENDFCMRAIEHGWLNIAALDTFVRHTGEISFAAGASLAKREGLRRLLAAHPRYDSLIDDYIKRDPMKEGRAQIDIGRFSRFSSGRGVLMIEHGWGGGIERHINDLVNFLYTEDVPTMVCASSKTGRRHPLKVPISDDYPNLPEIDWNDVEATALLLKALDLGHVHVHSIIGFDDIEVHNMLRAIELAGLRYDVTVHDYAPICPRINMIDWGGSYCNTPSAAYCRICIDRSGTPFENVDFDKWISLYRKVLDEARHIIVPSEDVAKRLRAKGGFQYQFIERPHPAAQNVKIPVTTRQPENYRTVGFIGAIGPHKGSRLLRAMSVDATIRKLPLRFIVYGYTDFESQASFSNITITGPYQDDRFAEVFWEEPSDLAFFASVWPETFCYALDHAFDNQIFPVSFDFGAPAARIKATGFGKTIDCSLISSPAAINDLLLGMSLPDPSAPFVEEGREWISRSYYYGGL